MFDSKLLVSCQAFGRKAGVREQEQVWCSGSREAFGSKLGKLSGVREQGRSLEANQAFGEN